MVGERDKGLPGVTNWSLFCAISARAKRHLLALKNENENEMKKYENDQPAQR